MKLVQVEGSTITMSMHWAEAAAIAEVLHISGYDEETAIAAFFETAAYAANLAGAPSQRSIDERSYSNVVTDLRGRARDIMTELDDRALRGVRPWPADQEEAS